MNSDLLPVVLYGYDPAQLRLIEVSAHAEALLGHGCEEWLQPGFLEGKVHPEDRGRLLGWRRRIISGEVGETLDYRLIHRSGAAVAVQDRARLHDGRVWGLLVEVGAPNARAASTAAAEPPRPGPGLATGEVPPVVGALVHQLNNPLAFILSNLDYLRAELIRAQQKGEPLDLPELINATSEASEGGDRMRRLLLPFTARPRRSPPRPPPRAEALSPGRRARVLVIDDEPSICSAVRRALGAEVEVVEMTRSPPALPLLLEKEFDLVLCDLMIPELSGMDLHAQLHAQFPDRAEAMVFLTGGAFSEEARAFLGRVPNRCLEKPFDLDQLLELVAERTGRAAYSPR
jgi:CheY-like chemotaxis protein